MLQKPSSQCQHCPSAHNNPRRTPPFTLLPDGALGTSSLIPPTCTPLPMASLHLQDGMNDKDCLALGGPALLPKGLCGASGDRGRSHCFFKAPGVVLAFFSHPPPC